MGKSKLTGRLRALRRGCGLLRAGGYAALAATVLLIVWYVRFSAGVGARIAVTAAAVIAVGAVIFAGTILTAVSARQIKLRDYILLLIFWWLPPVNFFLIRSFSKTARRELRFETYRLELENAREESQICRTKYPILMVHGIFFRDWQLVNYWGRIPASLIRNGASVHYGSQQSARSVPDCAAELRETILSVLAETGAEKVNIIAHSKGGLDSRYAISRLGMDEHVATLTTINTPHKGCDMVDYLLEKLPDSLAQFIAKRYNRIFSRLGDKSPDFMAGVLDLRASRAAKYDEEMPDSPLVSYRSVMSVMSSARSAGFPLNIGYLLIKRLNGSNDGLVWEESAKHGAYTLIETPGRRGISHGDVIDLMRENISGYDVREFYVKLVSGLAKEGY